MTFFKPERASQTPPPSSEVVDAEVDRERGRINIVMEAEHDAEREGEESCSCLGGGKPEDSLNCNPLTHCRGFKVPDRMKSAPNSLGNARSPTPRDRPVTWTWDASFSLSPGRGLRGDGVAARRFNYSRRETPSLRDH